MKSKKILSSLVLVMMLVLVFSSCTVIRYNDDTYTPSGNLMLIRTTEESIASINNIEFDLEVASVKIVKTDDDKIKVVEYGNNRYNRQHYIFTTTSNNTLSFSHETSTSKWDLVNSECVIYLPKSYDGKLDLEVEVGDLEISDNFPLASLHVDIEVGGVVIKNLAVQDLEVSVAVGGIEFGVPEGYSFNYEFKVDVGGIDSEITSGFSGQYGENPTAKVYLSTDVGGIEIYKV